MRQIFQIWKHEFRPMVRLAWPLVLAELGWMSMGVVDTMMVGRLPNSAEAIGAVSLGGILFYTVGIFGGGLLLGLDTLVSQAFGAKNVEECHRSLLSGVYLSVGLAPVLMGIVWAFVPILRASGIAAGVLREVTPYLRALLWSTLPLLLYVAFRRYLQGMNLVRPVTFALVSANLVNLVGNWMLIYGRWGAPSMGVEGSGWATCLARIYMVAVLLGYTAYYDHRHKTGLRLVELRPDLARIRRLVSLGLPAGAQFALEVGVFATATALIARLGALPLAAHQIALNTVSFTFMVPLGIASAAAVRVGQALGRDDPRGASHAGWAALTLAAGFMACTTLTFVLIPKYIVRLYTPDTSVVRTGVSLLLVAAVFQLFDGVQVVATGALRGAGDTRTPMVSHLLGYWLVGLPVGYFLCFGWGWGAAGLWSGLCVALIMIGIVLLVAWDRKVQSFSRLACVDPGHGVALE